MNEIKLELTSAMHKQIINQMHFKILKCIYFRPLTRKNNETFTTLETHKELSWCSLESTKKHQLTLLKTRLQICSREKYCPIGLCPVFFTSALQTSTGSATSKQRRPREKRIWSFPGENKAEQLRKLQRRESASLMHVLLPSEQENQDTILITNKYFRMSFWANPAW